MLKRLPFALLAISFSVPIVACLNQASREQTAGDANMLTDAEKAACNFGFAEVAADAADPAIEASPKDTGVAVSARPFLFADVTGDGKADVLTVSGKGEVSLFPGKGDGHFGAAVKTALGAPANSTPSAIALAGVGDFDGDGFQDFVAVQSVIEANPLIRKVGHYVIGYGKDDGSFTTKTLPFAIKDNDAKRLTKWTAIADLDHDGKDDLVVGGTDSETAFFGNDDRTMEKVSTGLPAGGGTSLTSARLFMFASTKTGLVVINHNKSWTVTFPDRHAVVAEAPISLPDQDMKLLTDLDGDDRAELTLFAPGQDNLIIQPLGKSAPAKKTFVKFDGTLVDNVDFGIDLANDGKRQLVFKTDARKLYAACGYSGDTNEIVAAELPIAYGDKKVVVGTPDFDGDGKPDFATYDFNAKALAIFLGAAPPATAPALTSYYVEGFHPGTDKDAGPADDGGPVVIIDTDAGPGDLDAGPDDLDAGPGPGDLDAGPKPEKDAGPGPKPDAGKDAGPKPTKDAGTQPGGDDDDDDTTAGDDDDDDVTPPKGDGKDKPKTKPSGSSSSGGVSSSGVTVTVKPKPEEDDGGCRTAPGRSDSSSSVALGGVVALFLLGNRRRKKAS